MSAAHLLGFIAFAVFMVGCTGLGRVRRRKGWWP